MSQSAPSDRLTALTFSVETTCFAGLMRFIRSSFLTVGSVRLYGYISSYGTSLLKPAKKLIILRLLRFSRGPSTRVSSPSRPCTEKSWAG